MSLVKVDHTTKAFDAELHELMSMTADMGKCAEHQVAEALDALVARNSIRGLQVASTDATLDAQQRQIEQKAVATIATRQPMAIDLREIVAVLRIANDLERIGDLAKNIGRRAVVLGVDKMPGRTIAGLIHLTNLAVGLLRDVLDSYAEKDSRRAIEVRNRDEEIDLMYTSLTRELIAHMSEDPDAVKYGIHLLFCAKNIERIGDHATNIAEAVYYMVEGRALVDERPKGDSTCIAPK